VCSKFKPNLILLLELAKNLNVSLRKMETIVKNLLENKHKLHKRKARNKIVIDSGHSNLEPMTKVGQFLPVNLVLPALRRY